MFVASAAVTFILSYSGCNRANSTLSSDNTEVNGEGVDSAAVERLLSEAHELIENGQGPPMQGILKYKEVLSIDSNNIEAIYQLGILSIQSNQLEKAAERFKKLILLRPENQEFKDTYERILEDLKSE